MPKPKGYADSNYLQMAASLMQPFKQRTYCQMQIRPGQRVLDIGCDPGTDTISLARLAGFIGQAIGVDAAMLVEANRHAASAGLGTRVKHIQADATTGLPCPSGIFYACRSERLFQYLSHAERVLDEMIGVTRTGGWIVALDTDHGTRSMDTPEVDIERRLAGVAAERCLTNGYAGHQLYRLFHDAGLTEVQAETVSIAFMDYALCREADLLDRWNRRHSARASSARKNSGGGRLASKRPQPRAISLPGERGPSRPEGGPVRGV